jgi:hypothetical protein
MVLVNIVAPKILKNKYRRIFMKRIISFFIVFIFIFVFSGCEPTTGGSNAKSKPASTSKPKPKPEPARDGKPPEILFEGIGKSYSVFTFEYVDKEKREHYRNLISCEIEKYPDEYYKIIGSYKIYVVKYLLGLGANGAAFGKERIIFINTARKYGDDQTSYNDDPQIRDIFHHEQHHIAEYKILGSNYYWKEWDKLFNEGIAAGPIIGDFGLISYPGFINRYQTTDPKEDRAELMSYWFDSSNNVIARAKEDDLLDKKVVLLFTLLRDRLSFPDPLREYNEKMGR